MFGQKRRRKKQGSIIEKKHVANARRYTTKKNGRYRGPWMSEWRLKKYSFFEDNEHVCTTHPFGTSTISSFCTLQRPRRFPPASTPLSSSFLKAASMTASSPILAFLCWQARMSLNASAGKQTAAARPLPAYQEVALSSTGRNSSQGEGDSYPDTKWFLVIICQWYIMYTCRPCQQIYIFNINFGFLFTA